MTHSETTLLVDLNARIAEMSKQFGVTGVQLFVCECPRPDCAEAVEVTLEEFAEVRQRETARLIAPGHVDPDRDRLILRTRRFAVTEQLH